MIENKVRTNIIRQELNKLFSKYKIKHHRVAIINPPLTHPDNLKVRQVQERAYHLHLPLGQLYMGSAIDDLTMWDSEVFDLNFTMLEKAHNNQEHDLKSLLKEIPKDFDTYLISCMFSSSEDVYRDLCMRLRKRRKLRILGGVLATGQYRKLLTDNIADIIIKFEAEYQVRGLLLYWYYLIRNYDGLDFNLNNMDLYNINFLSKNNVISFPDHYDGVRSLDIIPQLEKIKGNIPLYSTYGSLGHFTRALCNGRNSATLLGNRGCRGSCTYCSVRNFMGKGVRIFDEDRIIKTIRYLYEECNIRHIDFLDDDILADRDKAISLFNRIGDLNYDLVFTNNNASLARDINEEVVDAVAKAKFVQFGFGLETGNPEIRKKIHKTTNLKNLQNTIELFKQKYPNIFLHCNIMIGFPNETVKQILDTLFYSHNLGVDWTQVAIVQPLPNTPMWNEFVELDDPRVRSAQKYSPASESLHKGSSWKDNGFKVIDLFSIDLNHVPDLQELKIIWYEVNSYLNFFKTRNWENKDQMWKLQRMYESLYTCYPHDPLILFALAKCYSGNGNFDRMLQFKKYAGRELYASSFWRDFLNYMGRFDDYEIIEKHKSKLKSLDESAWSCCWCEKQFQGKEERDEHRMNCSERLKG